MAEDWLPGPPPSPNGADADNGIELFSHDIRSAVADVVGGLRLVDFSQLDAATAAQLQRVSTAGESLARLLDSALDQLGGARSESEPVPLMAILRNLERRWSGHARERSMSLRLDIAADLPTVLHLDSAALDRVLANLLSNAFKYADWGEVLLRVDMRSGEELRFRVCDQGPGFTDAALERLFERGGRPGGQTKPGSGLGLHIAKEVATRLGGQLQVSNAREGGAEVSLLLPRPAWAWAPASGADLASPDAPPVLPDLSGLTALVAEDNPTNQLLFTQMLDHLGASWKLAPDGAEALRLLSGGGFDFALVDIDMPELPGTEVIARTRALAGETRLIPILAVTAYVLQEHRERIYDAGADGILAKPVGSLAGFGQTIATLMLRTRGAAPEQIEPQPAHRPAHSEGEHPNFCPERLERLISISGKDGGREFLSRLHADLCRCRATLATAAAAGNADEVRAQTHVIISLSGAVGALPLQDLANLANAAAHRSEPSESQARTLAEIDTRLAGLIAAIAGEICARFPDATAPPEAAG
ncbi:ATP-binding protein [Oceanicola sp. 502str15]|uniref:hybrid sensor histidine kinase/response regulator n=1 Tax=Oceanicola sp. 502str15 TaxID=2696061 RepID=UPI0020944588|nr:ATP-binding protein [Oceanicola sp. 502str15]MCO6383665.1 response regulator [Oceanicola sp. 502str15]